MARDVTAQTQFTRNPSRIDKFIGRCSVFGQQRYNGGTNILLEKETLFIDRVEKNPKKESMVTTFQIDILWYSSGGD